MKYSICSKSKYLQIKKDFALHKLKMCIIGLGFFWLFAWSVFGSILGSQIEVLNSTNLEPSAFMTWQRTLLRSAHAHMNSMGITTILIGLTIPHIKGYIHEKFIKQITLSNIISIPIFGIGIVMESFYPPMNGKISFVTGVAATGGIIYIITIAMWSALFIFSAMKKNS
jgi:hypothetical protein